MPIKMKTSGGLLAPNPVTASLLQRKCGCGQHTVVGGDCEECKQKESLLQRRSAGMIQLSRRRSCMKSCTLPGSHWTAKPVLSLKHAPDTTSETFAYTRIREQQSPLRQSMRWPTQWATTWCSELGSSCPGASPGAHELTHVVQQSAGASHHHPQSKLEIGPQDDATESQAELFAGQIIGLSGASWSAASRLPKADAGATKLRRQPGSGSDEPEKKTPPLLQWGDYGIDVQPIVPSPIDLPSVEDVHSAYYKLTHPKKPKDRRCPPGWVMMKTGECCEGKSDASGSVVNTTKCCSPSRLTATATCCPPEQTAGGLGCEKGPGRAPEKIPGQEPKGRTPTEQEAKFQLRLPPMVPPLKLDFPIHFNQNQPGTAMASASELRRSLTQSGQGELETVISWLKRDSRFSVQLTGMASVEGPTENNTRLGEHRVMSVANALKTNGIIAARVTDPPGLPSGCTTISEGIHNCGDAMASSPMNPNDRQVRARVFVQPQETVIGKGSQSRMRNEP